MAGVKRALLLALGLSAALAGCNNGPSAVTGSQAAGGKMASVETPRSVAADGGVDHRKEPVKLVDGRPEWAASRRYSAEESAQKAFARNGEAFVARNQQDYVRRAHDFVGHPPKGVETLTRANGDTLYYDARNGSTDGTSITVPFGAPPGRNASWSQPL